MADQIVIKFTCIAHRTQRTYIQTSSWELMTSLLALCYWNTLDTGGFHSHGEIDAGLCNSYSCSREQTVELTFELPVVWDAIVLISTTEISIDFYKFFGLERWFIYSLPRRSFTRTMVHTSTVSVCRRTDRRTDKVQPITNILLPPSQEENGIAIATNVFFV